MAIFDNGAVSVCGMQVMGHVAAAQSASLVFLCVHREHYEFLETLAPQLKGKVNTFLAPSEAFVSKQLLNFSFLIHSADFIDWKVLVDVSNNLKKNIYPEANAEYLQR